MDFCQPLALGLGWVWLCGWQQKHTYRGNQRRIQCLPPSERHAGPLSVSSTSGGKKKERTKRKSASLMCQKKMHRWFQSEHKYARQENGRQAYHEVEEGEQRRDWQSWKKDKSSGVEKSVEQQSWNVSEEASVFIHSVSVAAMAPPAWPRRKNVQSSRKKKCQGPVWLTSYSAYSVFF